MLRLPRPITRDALQSIIADLNYWNQYDPLFAERQRVVREGFEELYGSGTRNGTPPSGPEIALRNPDETLGDSEQERDETIYQLNERWEELFKEYRDLLSNFPYPVPESVDRRLRDLDLERREIEDQLETFGEKPGHRFRVR